MNDQGEPNRIEIELTSHGSVPREAPPEDPTHGKADRDAGARTVGEPVVASGGRRRLVAGVSAIALLALLVGVAVGRMGRRDTAESDEASVTATTTTVLRSAAPRGDDSETLPAAEPLPAPSPTSPTTTSDDVSGDGLEMGSIDVHPAVAESEVEVVALTNRGQLVRIDVATGVTTSTDVQGSQFGPPLLHTGEGWVLLPSFDVTRGSTLVLDDGTRSTVDVGFSWPLLTTGSSGRFWSVPESDDEGVPQHLVESTVDGGPTGAEIALDGHVPRMLDPLGGVLVDAPGGSYVLTPESSTRLTTGRVLALGRRHIFVQECDVQLVCSYVVVERSSGGRRPLTLDPELGEAPNLESSAWWAFQEPWNESEDSILVVSWNPIGADGQSYGVLDLRDGEYTEIGEALDAPAARWSGDRSLFWIERGRLRWFDLDTGESVLVSEELGPINAFTIRPVATG